MILDYLEIGQVVGTHGIRGELRVNPWCDSPQFFKNFKTLYFDKKGEKAVKVVSSRPHGNIVLLKFDEVETVESATKLRNKVLYIKREDANLPDDRYFVQELIGCEVVDVDDNTVYGKISDVSETGANDVWHIKNDENEYLIPAIHDVVIDTDVKNNIVKIRPMKGIFDDED